ncbi:MAG TPA: hypothetical protein VEF36_01280 [Roseiarcus sp.]|nr:hypothetical protein [Roseiarcus sp.]
MSAFAPAALRAPFRASLRALTWAGGVALGLAIGLLARRVAPSLTPLAPTGLGLVGLASAGGLAATLEDAALPEYAAAFGLGALAVLAAALVPGDPAALEAVFGVGALGLAAGAAYSLAKAAPRRGRIPAYATLALGAPLIAALGIYFVVYVVVSRDLMIADFIYYRQVSIAVATLIDAGRWRELIAAIVVSMKDDYCWAAALAPGAVLALGAPLSRVAYSGAIIVFYAAPAILALGVLARDLACRAGLGRAGVARATMLAVAMVAVFVAYPTGVAVAARGMLDIGGLVLYVSALRLADRLSRLLALPRGHDRLVGRLTRRVALALALCVFAMFLFRRWYAFAAVGIAAMLALEIALLVIWRRARFRWRETVMAASLGALLLLALLSPVIVDWLPNASAHDYAAIYAAYRKPTAVFLVEIFDWFGAAVLTLAFVGAFVLAQRSADRRLLRLTCGAAIVAAVLFLRVETPYVHHLYLVAPAATALIAAPILLLFARARLAGLAALAALAAMTLTPVVGAIAPRGFAPIGGLPHAPREDLAELQRLKAWVDARARPDHRVCGLGSSYTFSGQLIEELWQLDPKHSPLFGDPTLRPYVKMSDVDTVEGPPNPQLKTCAILIVGDPVQTHIVPDYQLTVIVPSQEMLAGEGIGAHYRRTGEVFHLEKGVSAVVFERTTPLDDADMAALADRWRAARARLATGLRGAVGP